MAKKHWAKIMDAKRDCCAAIHKAQEDYFKTPADDELLNDKILLGFYEVKVAAMQVFEKINKHARENTLDLI